MTQIKSSVAELTLPPTLRLKRITEAMTKIIPLTKGYVTQVDDADYEWLNQWRWRYSKGYATRTLLPRRTAGRSVSMHRVIMNPPAGTTMDHINGDPLDNRRANLRVCTSSQNSRNRRTGIRNTSGFKGVTRHRQANKWQAQIGTEGKLFYLGLFDTAEEAARAYDAAARRLHGEFAKLNFGETL